MKLFLILFCLSGMFTMHAHAQDVLLNINLYPVQTIEVNDTGQTVEINYKTVDDYRNGVNTIKEDQLRVFSTAGFAVRVKSESPTLNNIGSDATINATDITMTASPGTINGLTEFSSRPVLLSGVTTEVLSSKTGAASKTVTMNYAAKGNNAYLTMLNPKQKPTVYSAQVTFSIEPM